MNRHGPIEKLVLYVLLSCFVPADGTAQLLLTGEVYSRQAQSVIVPLTSNWKATISRLAEEGRLLRTGDVVVEFDGAEASRQLEQQLETTRAEVAVTQRDLARLEKEVIQNSYAVQQAEVQYELDVMRAEVPEELIGALEYAENQLAVEKTQKALQDARLKLADSEQRLAERRQQAELGRQKAELTVAWWDEMLETFTVRAEQPGYVIHFKHPWTRAKFEEGDSVQTSYKIAQVADTSDLAIRVWVNGVDRPRIKAGAAVRITLDALPGHTLMGRLESISDSGANRSEWSNAMYFEGTVSLDEGDVSGLMPGMSAMVEVL